MWRLLRRITIGLLVAVLLIALVAAWVFGRFALRLQHFPASPNDGYHADFYVYLPASVDAKAASGKPAVLLVQPNNIGSPTDDVAAHISDAWWTAFGRHFLADDLEVVLLVPAFLRPRDDWQVYTHALDRDSLTTTRSDLARTDLQLIAMIDRLGDALEQKDMPLEPRVLIQGFSASGMFANRFAFLHPDRVLAVAAGSPGGWPIAPIESDAGMALPYPAGVSDLASLTGQPLDLQTLRDVPQLIVMGDRDENDSLDYGDGWERDVAAMIESRYGDTPLNRWPVAERLYRETGLNARFVLEPGIDHNRRALQHHSTEFFRKVLASRRGESPD